MAFNLSGTLNGSAGIAAAGSGLLTDASSLAAFGLDQKMWQIKEASFTTSTGTVLLFQTFITIKPYKAAMNAVNDNVSRRKIKYKIPYVDGQATDDLGREGGTFDFDVLIHGTQYKQGLAIIQKLIQQSIPGSLMHPVLGKIPCVIQDIQMVHEASSRNAVRVKLIFIEHNYGLLGLEPVNKNKLLSTVSSALATALETVNTIQNAIASVQAAVLFAEVLKASISNHLALFGKNLNLFLSSLNLTFNSKSASSLPSLVPVQQGGNLNPDGTISTSSNSILSTTVSTQVSPKTNQTIPASTVQAAINQANVLRDQIQSIITLMESGPNGALIFYDNIIALKKSAVDMTNAVNSAIATNNASLLNYTTPRLMSLREVAFLNGISVDRVDELGTLNKDLLSANYIPKDTLVVVPAS